MDETKELEEYLESISDKELAETIDFAFNKEFNEIDPDFQAYYQKELYRLRSLDALKVQINILKREKSKIKKYLKDVQKYETVMANLDTVEKMYNKWRSSLTKDEIAESSIIDWYEEFADMKWYDLEDVFPDIKISINLIKKILRTAREKNGGNAVKDRYKVTAPVKPEQNSEFEENQIDTSYSEKTDAELLEMLNRNDLEYLADMIGDAVVSRRTDKLRMAIRFTFAHFVQSDTKEKEYSRANRQSRKTSGKNIVDLLKEYNSMISE